MSATGLKEKVNKLVRKSKDSDEGFTYTFLPTNFECVGRKGIVEHIKDTQPDVYSDLMSTAGAKSDKDFQSQLSKLIMTVPISENNSKENKGNSEKKIESKVKENGKALGTKKEETIKNYPLSIDFMRTIDGRTTRIPNYGSLVGRIARILAMVVRKEQEGDMVKLVARSNDSNIGDYTDIFSYIEKNQSEFLNSMYIMFPSAKKRMDQFLAKAAENFDLEVPTLEQVEKLEEIEKNRKEAARREEMKKKLEKAKQDAAEIKKKREEAEKNRLALKRKQEEEARLNEYKVMKIDPNSKNAEEQLRSKKEIQRIEKCLKEKSIDAERKTRLSKRLNELMEKQKKEINEKKEKIIGKRMETCLENLSPKQLRKLCLEYFKNLDTQAASTNWPEICESVKIGDDYEFLTDFLCVLYDLAKFHDKKSFKVGHILVTSKQSENIVNKGIRSIRDFVKKDSWRIPTSWDFDIPEEELGEDWNRKDDSRLLIGASKFGKNLQKILASYPSMSGKTLDSSGEIIDAVKRRFGYLLNIYMNRGEAVEEFGDTLYTVDVEEEDNNWEDDLEEDEMEDDVIEDTKDMDVDNSSAKNGTEKGVEA